MVVLVHSVQYCSNNYVNHILITSAEQLFYVLYYRFVNKKSVIVTDLQRDLHTQVIKQSSLLKAIHR